MQKTQDKYKTLIAILAVLFFPISISIWVMRKKEWKISLRIAAIAIFWVVFIGLASMDEKPSKESDDNSNNEIVEEVVQAQPEATPQVEEKNEPTIPGLTAADIKLNLKDKGFACSGPDSLVDLVEWVCEDKTNSYQYTVEIVGESAFKIYVVTATAVNFTGQGVTDQDIQFLAYIASMPYEGAQPQEAKDWVLNGKFSYSDNEKLGMEKIFEPVRYFISGTGSLSILQMAHKDSTLD